MFLLLCVGFFYHFSKRINFILIYLDTFNFIALNCFVYSPTKSAVEFKVKLFYLIFDSESTDVFKLFKLVHNVLTNEYNVWVPIFYLKHIIVDETRVFILLE